MRNTWLIALREFRIKVRSRGFIISSLLVPVMLIAFLIFGNTSSQGVMPVEPEPAPVREEEQSPLGRSGGQVAYVDQTGFIHSVPASLAGVDIRAYPDVGAANQDLERGEIDAYYLIPPDYLSSGEIQRVSLDLPKSMPDSYLINYLLLENLFTEAAPEERARFVNPFIDSGIRYAAVPDISPAEGDETSPPGGAMMVGVSMLPLMVTFIIIIPLFTSGGYLLQSLGQEKGSRVMEILLNSLRPTQLLAGKLLGYGALTLVQYVIWFGLAAIALIVSGQNMAEMLGEIQLTYIEAFYMVLFALGGYTLYSAFMAGIGALAPNIEGGRSWVLLISLPMMVPIYFWALIVNAPHGPLAVALSLFPFSAPVAMLMRLTSTTVPLWQVGLSLVLLVLTSMLVIWSMARLFRVQALLSGEAISLGRIWAVMRHP